MPLMIDQALYFFLGGGSGGGPVWLPAGATTYLDFLGAHYYSNGNIDVAADLVGPGIWAFDPSTDIDGDGMHASDTQQPMAIGDFLADVKARMDGGTGCTILVELIPSFANCSGPVLDWYAGPDSNSSSDYMQSWLDPSGSLQFYDDSDLNIEIDFNAYTGQNGIAWDRPNIIGFTIGLPLGGGLYQYGISINGAGFATQDDITYAAAVVSLDEMALGHWDAGAGSNIDGVITKITVLDPMDEATLRAATAQPDTPLFYGGYYDAVTAHTSLVVQLPSVYDVGDMLFVFVGWSNASAVVSIASGTGWTLASTVNVGTGINANYAYKIADGTDALTLGFTGSTDINMACFSIKNCTTVDVAHTTSTSLTGNSSGPIDDPASLTFAHGAGKYAVMSMRVATNNVVAFVPPDNMNKFGYQNFRDPILNWAFVHTEGTSFDPHAWANSNGGTYDLASFVIAFGV